MPKTCEACGVENGESKHFCSGCGQVLPESGEWKGGGEEQDSSAEFFPNGSNHVKPNADRHPGQSERPAQSHRQSRKQSSSDAEKQSFMDGIFGKAFGSNASATSSGGSESSKEQARGRTGPASRSAGQTEPISRIQALKTVTVAASKAAMKSLALSAAVLGPGFVLLLAGYPILGMIWLFLGSFGMMAWTYRKPWQLGWISCLIPPVCAFSCYLVQLWIFDQIPPLSWLAAGILVGTAIGFFRGQSHHVYSEDGAIFAQRTIMYLLVWVVAYGAGQALAMTVTNSLAIRGGLVTGAMTTAMLVMVSSMIVLRWRHVSVIAAGFAILLSFSLYQTPVLAQANDTTKLNRYFTAEFQRLLSQQVVRGLPCNPDSTNTGDADFDLFISAWVNLSCGGWTTGDFSKKKAVLMRISFSGRKSSFLGRSPDLLRNKQWRVQDNLYQDSNISTNTYFGSLRVATQEAKDFRTKHTYVAKREATTRFESRQFYVFPNRSEWDNRLIEIQVEVRFYDRDTKSYSGMSVDPAPIAMKLSQEVFDLVVRTLGKPQGEPGSQSSGQSVASLTSASGSGDNLPSTEEIAAVTAALATALVAAGVAVNVAQAVAAAIANALQSGVQLTAEEIQAAVMEGLSRGKSDDTQSGSSSSGRGRSPPGNSDSSLFGTFSRSSNPNAPPNVQSTERVRAPTPVYNEDGHPFKTNGDGEYLAPDKDGNLVWMDRQGAEEAAASLREERANQDAERERVEREARREREQWWGKQEQESQEAEQDRKRREAAARQEEADEKTRRDNLETVISNTLGANPDRSDYSELMSRLANASQDEDSSELENIWYELVGERQQQLDQMGRESEQRQQEASDAQFREDAAVFLRNRGKNAAQAGLALASGGSLSIAQAGALALSNTGINAIESGLTNKGDSVQFDGWQATRGASRGLANSASSMVGGVASNGNAAIMAGKTVFSATNTYGQTYADTYDKTGDHDLAHSRAGMAAAADAGKTVAGEYFDERMRQSDLAAQRQTMDTPSGAQDVTDPNWLSQHANSLQQMNKVRADAAKTASNLLGNTLGNIATADRDKDAETDVAVWNAVKTEAEGHVWSRVASRGAKSPDLTPEQQAVLNRLQGERMGTAPRPEITPEYADYLRSRGVSLEDYSPGPEHAEPGGGFNRAAQQHAQRVADNIGGQVLARTVESEGQQAIDSGLAVPKGPDMKANSGRDVDTVLGMDPNYLNRVVVFEPTMPKEEAFAEHLGRQPTKSDWDTLEARRQKRQDQFDYYNEKLGKEGYPYHREEGGQRVIDSESGLPIAGDMDLFDYRGLYGEPLPQAVREEAARQQMRNPNMMGQNIASTVEHPAHMQWDISGLDNKVKGPDGKTEFERARETKIGIINQVRPEGDGGPLAVFSARLGLASEQAGSSYYTGPGSDD